MSGTVPNMVVVDGQIARLAVRKQKETLGSRERRVFDMVAALSGHYAFKHSGVWRVYEVATEGTTRGWQRYAKLLRTFPNEDAAAMWLLHKAMRS